MLDKVNQEKLECTDLISVILPVFNGELFISKAIQSILNQSYSNFELIILNDGSTDNTLRLLRDSEASDSRIRVVSRENRGLACSLNEGVDLARGQWIVRMDADDVAHPNRFARQLTILKNKPELDLVATRAIVIDEQNYIAGLFPFKFSHQEICTHPWRGFHFPHPTWMGHVDWFRKYRYTEPGPLFCEDQELMLRTYKICKFETIDEILLAYRISKKINWGKLALTRNSVLSVQLRHFYKMREYHFLVLSLLGFLLNVSRDLILRILGKHFFKFQPITDFSIVNTWETLLKRNHST